MDPSILLILLQDGVVNGAIYALLALSLVLAFTVTRVIFIPAGELVAFAALTDAAIGAGHIPAILWLLAALGAAAFAAGLVAARHTLTRPVLLALTVETLLTPAAIIALVRLLAPTSPGPVAAALLSFAAITPMAPYLYRIAYQPLAEASVLVLLIASIGVHLALLGLGLLAFGPEGARADPLIDARLTLGSLDLTAQSVAIVATTLALMAALALFFTRTLAGKALRATAINRLGARLVGIGTALSGRVAFLMAGAVAAICGILIAPQTTVYYDSGFLIGLKGFVAAIVGGLVSYPLAAAAALLVGCVESFASFYASAFKEVIVFTLIIPVLLWRSLANPGATPVTDE